jgi:hypothetical protein
MPFQRLPESVQTLYAELLEQTIQAEAEAAAVGAGKGTFVAKNVKGATYWYLQRTEGDRKRQQYLGRESPALLAWMEDVRQAPSREKCHPKTAVRLPCPQGPTVSKNSARAPNLLRRTKSETSLAESMTSAQAHRELPGRGAESFDTVRAGRVGPFLQKGPMARKLRYTPGVPSVLRLVQSPTTHE